VQSQGEILLIDEIDGLLGERTIGAPNWVITRANEWLCQLDNFTGVFVGTTNRIDAIDPAFLRRFGVKIHFDYLRSEQRVSLFQRTFGPLDGDAQKAVHEQLATLDCLTPGDFTVVKRYMVLMAEKLDAKAIIGRLRAEVSLKQHAYSSPLGFTARLR